MRLFHGVSIAVALVLVAHTQGQAQMQEDATRKVAGGGIKAAGWTGVADTTGDSKGFAITDGLFTMEGNSYKATTGPAATYWNPKNMASGNYTVKATFNEPKYMSLNTHAHPYGIMIAGNDLGTPTMSMLYCSAYGDGRFIVRGFGPTVFNVNGRGEPNAAINKAAEKGAPVTQEVALSVKGDKVECAINGTVVGSYDKATLVGAGKLKSTDGVYGLRFGHNTDAIVTGFGITKG